MKRILNSLKSAPLGICFMAMAAVSASAQALPDPETGDGTWRHAITPFLFLPLSTEMTSVVDDSSVDLDLNLSDLRDVLPGQARVRYEGWNGDFGFIFSLYHVYRGDDASLPLPNATVDVDVRQTYLSLMGACKFAEGVNASGCRYARDASFGVRWNRSKQVVDIRGPGPGMDLGRTEEWFEPAKGLRYAVELNDKWTFTRART